MIPPNIPCKECGAPLEGWEVAEASYREDEPKRFYFWWTCGTTAKIAVADVEMRSLRNQQDEILLFSLKIEEAFKKGSPQCAAKAALAVPDSITPFVGDRYFVAVNKRTGRLIAKMMPTTEVFVEDGVPQMINPGVEDERLWTLQAIVKKDMSWEPGENLARCVHPHTVYGQSAPFHRHDAPQERCSCGFYACRDLDELMTQRILADHLVNIAHAKVELYGKVIPGSKGYRAQKARVAEINLLLETFESQEVLEAALTGLERYGVPVNIIPTEAVLNHGIEATIARLTRLSAAWQQTASSITAATTSAANWGVTGASAWTQTGTAVNHKYGVADVKRQADDIKKDILEAKKAIQRDRQRSLDAMMEKRLKRSRFTWGRS